MTNDQPVVAYFSMEVALTSLMPTYSGGLGVLAGDFVRSAADMGLPLVGVTLLSRSGYLYQRLDNVGNQIEEPVLWPVDDYLDLTEATCSVAVEGREVKVRSWRYNVVGVTGTTVPVFFLDTDIEDNDPYDRALSHYLYGGDQRYRLCQEVVLGTGGVRMLRALGYTNIDKYHANEGHASLLCLEVAELGEGKNLGPQALLEWVRDLCVFTTHTPVPAGHDRFPLDLAESIIGPENLRALQGLDCCREELNMTEVALHLSSYINGVARSHGQLARTMFPTYPIDSITNGVHSATWTAAPFQRLYDDFVPDWRRHSQLLRYVRNVPLDRIWDAHQEAKRELLDDANHQTNVGMDLHVFTIGFARRVTAYKRPGLLNHDIQRLNEMARRVGPLQIIYSGKAHPSDEAGKEAIRQIFKARGDLGPEIRMAYLPNYDMDLAALLVAGVDLWLNTPLPPYEASGTSGMKAAHNGVPSLSTLDGWWQEGHIEGVTGWAIGQPSDGLPAPDQSERDADDLYDKLSTTILPLFYDDRQGWTDVMRQTIAYNASFFNAQRMVQEYAGRAYGMG